MLLVKKHVNKYIFIQTNTMQAYPSTHPYFLNYFDLWLSILQTKELNFFMCDITEQI